MFSVINVEPHTCNFFQWLDEDTNENDSNEEYNWEAEEQLEVALKKIEKLQKKDDASRMKVSILLFF